MTCPKCGGEVAQNQAFCPRCGQKVDGQQADLQLQQIHQNLLAEKKRLQQSAQVGKMAGKQCEEGRPPKKAIRLAVLIVLSIASLVSLYFSFPPSRDVVVRGYEPALYFVRKFAPKFLAKVPCEFAFLAEYGFSGAKGIVCDVLPYVSLLSVFAGVLAIVTVCFGLRYRSGVRFFGLLFFGIALLSSVVQLVGYTVLYESVLKPFPYGGVTAFGINLLTLVVFLIGYRKPKNKGE